LRRVGCGVALSRAAQVGRVDANTHHATQCRAHDRALAHAIAQALVCVCGFAHAIIGRQLVARLVRALFQHFNPDFAGDLPCGLCERQAFRAFDAHHPPHHARFDIGTNPTGRHAQPRTNKARLLRGLRGHHLPRRVSIILFGILLIERRLFERFFRQLHHRIVSTRRRIRAALRARHADINGLELAHCVAALCSVPCHNSPTQKAGHANASGLLQYFLINRVRVARQHTKVIQHAISLLPLLAELLIPFTPSQGLEIFQRLVAVGHIFANQRSRLGGKRINKITQHIHVLLVKARLVRPFIAQISLRFRVHLGQCGLFFGRRGKQSAHLTAELLHDKRKQPKNLLVRTLPKGRNIPLHLADKTSTGSQFSQSRFLGLRTRLGFRCILRAHRIRHGWVIQRRTMQFGGDRVRTFREYRPSVFHRVAIAPGDWRNKILEVLLFCGFALLYGQAGKSRIARELTPRRRSFYVVPEVLGHARLQKCKSPLNGGLLDEMKGLVATRPVWGILPDTTPTYHQRITCTKTDSATITTATPQHAARNNPALSDAFSLIFPPMRKLMFLLKFIQVLSLLLQRVGNKNPRPVASSRGFCLTRVQRGMYGFGTPAGLGFVGAAPSLIGRKTASSLLHGPAFAYSTSPVRSL